MSFVGTAVGLGLGAATATTAGGILAAGAAGATLGSAINNSRNQKDAIKSAEASQQQAVDAQLQLGRENIDFLREQGDAANQRLQPFVEFGESTIPSLNRFLTAPNTALFGTALMMDPENQVSFLENNPMFDAALGSVNEQSKRLAAAQGKANSGGLVQELFNNYLATGQSFINDRFNQFGAMDALRTNDFNRLLAPVGIGQASAAGQVANINNTSNQVSLGNQNLQGILGNRGDIAASSAIQQQNINNQQNAQLMRMGTGALLGSGVLGNQGVAGGGLGGAIAGGLIY